MEYEFSVDKIDEALYSIEVETKDCGFKLLINTYDDPYQVYYGGGQALETLTSDNDFEKKLFDYLEANYPDVWS